MKKLLLSIGFIALILLVYILSVSSNKNSLQTILGVPTPTPVFFEGSNAKNAYPVTPISPIITDTPSDGTQTSAEQTQQQVKTFLSNFPTDSVGEKIITDTPDYTIFYLVQTGNFTIIINSSPFPQKRTEAENAFLSHTKLSKNQACQLSVTTTTTTRANPDFAGEDYPLSFCGGSVD